MQNPELGAPTNSQSKEVLSWIIKPISLSQAKIIRTHTWFNLKISQLHKIGKVKS